MHNNSVVKEIIEKCSYQLEKKMITAPFDSIIMLRFGKTKVAKEGFYSEKTPIKTLGYSF